LSLSKLVVSLLNDSKKYLSFARDEFRKGNDLLAFTYCRAVFLSSWSAMEGWINYIAHSFAQTDSSLTKYEISFLREKKITVDENGLVQITNQDEYRPTLTKLVFVLRRFGTSCDLKQNLPDLWRRLKVAEQTRHSIAHPKTRDQELKLGLQDAV